MTKQNLTLTASDLRQFTGDLVRYQTIHPMVIFSPGLKYVADHGGAYWLIDAIASYYGSPILKKAFQKDSNFMSLHFWELHVAPEQTATLTAIKDADIPPVVTQDISYTDFPLRHIRIYSGFDGKRWTLYLPSEH